MVVPGAAARPRRWSWSSSRSAAQSSMRVGSRRSIVGRPGGELAIDPRQARVRHVRGAARREGPICRECDIGWTGPEHQAMKPKAKVIRFFFLHIFRPFDMASFTLSSLLDTKAHITCIPSHACTQSHLSTCRRPPADVNRGTTHRCFKS